MKTLTYNPADDASTNIHGNQQIISDINNQHIELDKGMIIANTLKGKLNSLQSTNASWIVTTIKAKLKYQFRNSKRPFSHSRELIRQQSGIAKYSRNSRVA